MFPGHFDDNFIEIGQKMRYRRPKIFFWGSRLKITKIMAIFVKNLNFLAIIQLSFLFFFQILPFSQQRILQHSTMAKILKKMEQNKWILYATFAL